MNIQYSKKKQELKTDPFVGFLIQVKEYAKARSSALIGGLIAVLLVIAVVMSYNSMAKSRLSKAQEAFGSAMMAFTANDDQKAIEAFAVVTENHGNSPQAAYAAYLLGHILRRQDRCDEAITWFEMAKSKSKSKNFISGGALEAMATCYESMDNLDEAIRHFEMALEDKKYEYRYPALRWKLALLNKGQSNYDKAKGYCQDIVSDTLATALKQDAENLLIELNLQQGS